MEFLKGFFELTDKLSQKNRIFSYFMMLLILTAGIIGVTYIGILTYKELFPTVPVAAAKDSTDKYQPTTLREDTVKLTTQKAEAVPKPVEEKVTSLQPEREVTTRKKPTLPVPEEPQPQQAPTEPTLSEFELNNLYLSANTIRIDYSMTPTVMVIEAKNCNSNKAIDQIKHYFTKKNWKTGGGYWAGYQSGTQIEARKQEGWIEITVGEL